MKPNRKFTRQGFTLLETVIAIGVLAVLLTGFMVVFAPAAAGIKKSINVQEADRLASTIEQELVTQRTGDKFKTGFEKAFTWIKTCDTANTGILVYQYRGKLGGSTRPDGTLEPVANFKGQAAGKDYVVVPMARLKNDDLLSKDLEAVEGSVYLVKCTQLVYSNTGLGLGKIGKIVDPKGTADAADADSYPEAVIAFAADFYPMPAKTSNFFSGKAYDTAFTKAKTPVFTRNLAVRR